MRTLRLARPSLGALLVWLTLATSLARADRTHVVRPGQTLSRIAKRYQLSPGELAERNGLRAHSTLRTGQVLVLPERGVVHGRQGRNLASITRHPAVDSEALARRDRLTRKSRLRPGQRLERSGLRPTKNSHGAGEAKWGTPRQRGVITVHRLWSKEKRRIRIFDTHGRVRPAALAELRHLLRPRESRRRKAPHPRLVGLLARVSDHFGGRPLQIVSGLRVPGGYTRDSSRHVAAEAVDFRIPGVPLSELRDFCLGLEHVGVGYYPRSDFVHLDVRTKSARWTDWSAPGEAPRLEVQGDRQAADDEREEPSAPLVHGAGAPSEPAEDEG